MSAFSIMSCSQTNKQSITNNQQPMYDINQYVFPEAKDITEKNYVDKVVSNIKHYDKEPIYYLRINKQNCLIEVYVNNVHIYKDFEVSNLVTPIEVGHILKSGKQSITVKMYPVGNLNNENLGVKDAPPVTKLEEGSQVSISVVTIDEKSPKSLDDEKLITKMTSPKDGTGKEFYEFSFTFDAKVPYEFEGWTKGQDIRKLDQDLVRKKAVEFYEMIGKIHVNKNLDDWLKLNYPSDIRTKSSYFRDRQNIIETLAEYKEDVEGANYTVKPIKDYKMEYMGDGKLLRLRQSSMEQDYRGRGALCLTYGEGGLYFPGITLYLPEGRDLTTQGFMMWK